MSRPARVCVALVGLLLGLPTLAELPLARLKTVFPPGGQIGASVEVTLSGDDLAGVTQLHFADPSITASLKKPATTAPTEPLKFTISIGPAARLGAHDLRAIGRFGISNPRTFLVAEASQRTAAPDNTSIATATPLPFGSAAYAIAAVNASQFYRVHLPGRYPTWVCVETTAIESKMEASFVVTDIDGREMQQSRNGQPLLLLPSADEDVFIAVHDVLYRAGPQFFYRILVSDRPDHLHPLPSSAAFVEDDLYSLTPRLPRTSAKHDQESTARVIYPPCEIEGRFTEPHYRDWYRFDVPAGAVYRLEVVSQRLGEPTLCNFVVQKGDAQGKLTDLALPPEPLTAAAPEFSGASRDPVYRLDVKDAGSYRIMARNLFARDAAYRLIIRGVSPDFSLVAVPNSPLPQPADSREVPIWTTLIRKGGVTPIAVIAARRDGFNGDIELHVEGLPPAVKAAPAYIASGASGAIILLTASDTAQPWFGPIRVWGESKLGMRHIRHYARPGVVSDSEYDANTKIPTVRSRVSDEFMVAVSAEPTPLSIRPATTQATVGSKTSVSLKLTRHADFTSPVTLRLVGHPLVGPVPPAPFDAKVENGSIALDLAQLKMPVGEYRLYAEGLGKFKYLGFDGKAAPTEVTASFYSEPFMLRILPAPATTQSTTRPTK